LCRDIASARPARGSGDVSTPETHSAHAKPEPIVAICVRLYSLQ
jgi:hypothetical protein